VAAELADSPVATLSPDTTAGILIPAAMSTTDAEEPKLPVADKHRPTVVAATPVLPGPWVSAVLAAMAIMTLPAAAVAVATTVVVAAAVATTAAVAVAVVTTAEVAMIAEVVEAASTTTPTIPAAATIVVALTVILARTTTTSKDAAGAMIMVLPVGQELPAATTLAMTIVMHNPLC
jgi:hypothetical protein